jgi:hypothetical protein
MDRRYTGEDVDILPVSFLNSYGLSLFHIQKHIQKRHEHKRVVAQLVRKQKFRRIIFPVSEAFRFLLRQFIILFSQEPKAPAVDRVKVV